MIDKPAAATPETEAVRLARIAAYREVHRQLVEMQRAFQRAMSEAQIAFLKTMEASLAGLASLEEPAATDAAPEPPPTSGPSDRPDPSDLRPPAAEEPARSRFAVHAEHAVPAGLALSGLAAASQVVVVGEGTGVARALAEQLQAHGVAAEEVAAVPAGATAAIFLGGLRPVSTLAEILDVHREAWRAARTLARRFTTGSGLFVTVQDTGGDLGLAGRAGPRAGLAGLAGLAKTARLEWPGVTVKAIDLERGSRPAWKLARVLAEELFTGGPELEVGLLADGGRVVPRSTPAPLDPAPVDRGALGQGALLVAAGGVTTAELIALARYARPRMLLLGRTPLDAGAADDEVGRSLAALRQAGSEVRYRAVDTRDRDAVARALAEARRDWGAVTGLVHGTGTPVSRLIAEHDDRAFEEVLHTRIGGFVNLLDATAEDPLDLIVLLTSTAARAGERGAAADAVAAEALNKMAAAEHARRGGACLVKALNRSRPESTARQVVEEIRAAIPDQVEVILGAVPHDGPDPRPDSLPVLTMDVFVSAATHPFLEGYRVGGVPALPLVLVLEWFSRIARAHGEELEMVACRELTELGTVPLERFYEEGDAFTVVSHRDHPDASLDLRLGLYAGRRCCATALAALARPGTTVTASADAARLIRTAHNAQLRPWPFATIYGQALDRGPELQVIREILGVSDDGIVAVVAGTCEMGWADGWRTDVAAIEGGLQMAVLWFQYQLGGRAAVTGVGSYRGHFSGLAEGPVRAILRGRNDGFDRVTCNVVFINENGTLMAELCDVEARAHGRPAEARPAEARPAEVTEISIELEAEAEPEAGEESAAAEERR